MTNILIPEVNMLKNSSTLAGCIAINISIELGFISVNGTRETYFVDSLSKIIERMLLRNLIFENNIHAGGSCRKRLVARLPPLGSRVRASITPCGFRGGRNGIWVCFLGGFSRFPLSQISFHHFFTFISFISFHKPLWWCDRRGRPASLLSTPLQHRGFIASHPSTRSVSDTSWGYYNTV